MRCDGSRVRARGLHRFRRRDGGVTIDVPETVAIGVLPDPLTDQPTLPPPPARPPTAAPAVPATRRPQPTSTLSPIGDNVWGRTRVCSIGDGTLLSAAPPNDSRMCRLAQLFGWDAELDAIDGDDLTVVDDVLDAASLPTTTSTGTSSPFVGNQLPPDQFAIAELEETLATTIERVAPRPVVLSRCPDRSLQRTAVDDVIRSSPTRTRTSW